MQQFVGRAPSAWNNVNRAAVVSGRKEERFWTGSQEIRSENRFENDGWFTRVDSNRGAKFGIKQM
jgi:hypothetical protein